MIRVAAVSVIFILLLSAAKAGNPSLYKLPDTGQTASYTSTFGEDSDYLINAPSFTDNGNGTITDNNTGLIWQKADGGEMTFENAGAYCDNLILGGYSDWRMPDIHELVSILNHSRSNPAVDTFYFTKTLAEYWWSSDTQVDNVLKIWVANAGGGTGPHLKTETISAGGTKRFHVRAVRNSSPKPPVRLIDNNNGTITDMATGLMWQKLTSASALTWEQALTYCENLSLAGYADWRLPNLKELQSINNELLKNPSVDTLLFKNIQIANYWTSTTLNGQNTKAWYMNTAYGLVTYDIKTLTCNVIGVRGESLQPMEYPALTLIKSGTFSMGDHHGYIDPQHPSDELPLHTVKVDSFYIGTFELTNQQYCDYLNSAKQQGLIEVRNNLVYAVGDTNIYCFTKQYADYSSLSYNGTSFSVADFRANHPIVGIMWYGAAAYCNWLSQQFNLPVCYNLTTWNCDFTKNGFRLPTEAEWEYAGRGGRYNPYYVFPWGNDSMTLSRANWPSSGDPYETGSLPYTTPVGFYDGQLKLKSDYNWPGSASSYQTTNGSNVYGLYDMAGNVWEFVNDWYKQNYYSWSPGNNPQGPSYDSATVMPDGKKYRGMRSGNWYNGQWGHSRVANRNPSYYRGPQDPNHPWYHVGFRVARFVYPRVVGINNNSEKVYDYKLYQNYPNPFNPVTRINIDVPEYGFVTLSVYNALGKKVSVLVNEYVPQGSYEYTWNAGNFESGIYFCRLETGLISKTIKMILIK